MVRYKKHRRGYSGTRSIKMKFQSFMDIATSDSGMQIITISAGGKSLLERCPAQFSAYKYFLIGSVSVKLVPASTLPVDPSGLSYEAGENQVDPRDQLTPGMMRITNGEDILEDLTGISAANQIALYNNMLLDPRWFKWMLQSGVKRHATPRYWQIGQLHQDKWPGADVNYPAMHFDGENWVMDGTMHEPGFINVGDTNIKGTPILSGSSSRGIFQTGHMGRLGWLPTDGLAVIGEGLEQPFIASPPEVEVMKILLPPARATKYYYRMFITETVYFKEPLVTLGLPVGLGAGLTPYRPLDVFHYANAPSPLMPTDRTIVGGLPDSKTGGNYGDD